jgi:hypothetical protein
VRRPFAPVAAAALLPVLLGACAGSGEGFVTGSLWIDNCRDGDPFGGASGSMSDFDLQADFFAGESQEDSNKSLFQRRNGLLIRVQDTSNNIEDSNGIAFQIADVAKAAASFAEKDPIDVTYNGEEPSTAGPLVVDEIRSHLYVYAICPSCSQPLVATSNVLADAGVTASGQSCRKPTGVVGTSCPTLTDETRAELDDLCAGPFDDKSVASRLKTLLGEEGACIYFCELGSAARGADPESFGGFVIDYGDTLAALFSLKILDGRSIDLESCAAAFGEVQGMFRFDLTRGRAAQAFP